MLELSSNDRDQIRKLLYTLFQISNKEAKSHDKIIIEDFFDENGARIQVETKARVLSVDLTRARAEMKKNIKSDDEWLWI